MSLEYFRNDRAVRIFLGFIAVGAIILFINRLFSFDLKEIDLLLVLYQSLFFYVGLSTGPLLLFFSFITKRFSFFYFILGTLASILILASLQTRGAVVYTAVWIIFLGWFIIKKLAIRMLLVAGIILLVFSFSILGGLPAIGIQTDPKHGLSIAGLVKDHKHGNRDLVEEIEWRFGANTRMSTAFINMYDRGDGAGINPIKNSLLGFIPRKFNPDKPHPSTVDGNDIYSQGMYIISREIHGYNTFNMVEFSTGGHFYWEFGWLGVIFLSLLSGLYISLAVVFLPKLGLASLPVMFALFKPFGFVEPKIWVSDIVIQIYQVILPLIFTWWCISWFLKKKIKIGLIKKSSYRDRVVNVTSAN